MRKFTKRIIFTVLPLLVAAALLLTSCDIVFGSLDSMKTGDYLWSYDSPDGRYTLEIYHGAGGATVDFSIVGVLIDNSTENKDKKNIYYRYHESEATVVWNSDTVVTINGIRLDVSKNETYDGRLDD